MGFCVNGIKAAKKILSQVDDTLENIIANEVLPITGAIKKLESNLVVNVIISLIPAGSTIEKAINIAIDGVTKVEAILKAPDFHTKLKLFIEDLEGYVSSAKNGILIKLASLASAFLDGSRYPESTYDLVVQGTVVAAK